MLLDLATWESSLPVGHISRTAYCTKQGDTDNKGNNDTITASSTDDVDAAGTDADVAVLVVGRD